MSAKSKKSGRLSFRIPATFDAAVDSLAADSGWKRSDIGLCGLITFWPEIAALAMSTHPTTDPDKVAENRELARLFRSARANKLDVRGVLVAALSSQIETEAAAKSA
jgi:hypothetical protein